MGIILEDDDVPSQSFFPYCKELLEKYKDDSRINMICGMNNVGSSKKIKDSYFFTKKGSIWGWASWRRVLDTWDGAYTWLDDEEKMEIIRKQMKRRDYENYIKTARMHRKSGKEYYESINAAAMYLNDSLNIVPRYNMISNIGIAQESTHSTSDIRLLPKRIQKLFYMKTYNIQFPLIHPTEIKRNYRFEREMTPSKARVFFDRIEHIFRVWKYLGFKEVIVLIRNKQSKK